MPKWSSTQRAHTAVRGLIHTRDCPFLTQREYFRFFTCTRALSLLSFSTCCSHYDLFFPIILGPDNIRILDNPEEVRIVEPSAGVHITLPSYFGASDMGLLDPKTSDGRVVFMLPWEGVTLVGTTDTPSELSFEPVYTRA